jgi:hypothetical protein
MDSTACAPLPFISMSVIMDYPSLDSDMLINQINHLLCVS